MVYGIIQLINFAHGEIYMFGAYFGLILITVFHIPFWFALPLAMVLCALLGMLIDYVAYRPLRNAPRLSALITAIGISIALQNLARMFWTAEPKVYRTDSLPSLFVSGLNDMGEVINRNSSTRRWYAALSGCVYSADCCSFDDYSQPIDILYKNREGYASMCTECHRSQSNGY